MSAANVSDKKCALALGAARNAAIAGALGAGAGFLAADGQSAAHRVVTALDTIIPEQGLPLLLAHSRPWTGTF